MGSSSSSVSSNLLRDHKTIIPCKPNTWVIKDPTEDVVVFTSITLVLLNVCVGGISHRVLCCLWSDDRSNDQFPGSTFRSSEFHILLIRTG